MALRKWYTESMEIAVGRGAFYVLNILLRVQQYIHIMIIFLSSVGEKKHSQNRCLLPPHLSSFILLHYMPHTYNKCFVPWGKRFAIMYSTQKVIMYHSLCLPVLSLNSLSPEKPISLDCLICKYWACTTKLPEGKSNLQNKMFRLFIMVEVSIHESTFHSIILALLL